MARRYRTVLRLAAAEGPNFNGHYRVARWGCGTNCLDWAIIDLMSGDTWFPSEQASNCWAPHESDRANVPDYFELRLGSSLLVLNECLGPGADG
jgi:hypothetical protein